MSTCKWKCKEKDWEKMWFAFCLSTTQKLAPMKSNYYHFNFIVPIFQDLPQMRELISSHLNIWIFFFLLRMQGKRLERSSFILSYNHNNGRLPFKFQNSLKGTRSFFSGKFKTGASSISLRAVAFDYFLGLQMKWNWLEL